MSHPLLSLLQLSDPALPIGSYAHSGGLETYVQMGVVHDFVTAEGFVREMLCTNLYYTDAALVVLAYRAASEGDVQRLEELDLLCEAVKIPREIRQASAGLGGRLLKIFKGAGDPGIRHYPVVFGYSAASLGTGLQEALTGFYYNAAAGMVTNCVKLVPLGQQDGQRVLFSLQSLIGQLVSTGMEPEEGLIGLSCTGLDIRCMQHEELYSRLFMS